MTEEQEKPQQPQSKNPIEAALKKIAEAETKSGNQEIEKQVDIVLKAKKVFLTEFDKLKEIVVSQQAKKGEFNELIKDIKTL